MSDLLPSSGIGFRKGGGEQFRQCACLEEQPYDFACHAPLWATCQEARCHEACAGRPAERTPRVVPGREGKALGGPYPNLLNLLCCACLSKSNDNCARRFLGPLESHLDVTGCDVTCSLAAAALGSHLEPYAVLWDWPTSSEGPDRRGPEVASKALAHVSGEGEGEEDGERPLPRDLALTVACFFPSHLTSCAVAAHTGSFVHLFRLSLGQADMNWLPLGLGPLRKA